MLVSCLPKTTPKSVRVLQDCLFRQSALSLPCPLGPTCWWIANFCAQRCHLGDALWSLYLESSGDYLVSTFAWAVFGEVRCVGIDGRGWGLLTVASRYGSSSFRRGSLQVRVILWDRVSSSVNGLLFLDIGPAVTVFVPKVCDARGHRHTVLTASVPNPLANDWI